MKTPNAAMETAMKELSVQQEQIFAFATAAFDRLNPEEDDPTVYYLLKTLCDMAGQASALLEVKNLMARMESNVAAAPALEALNVARRN
ncbi:hypothetical protein [Eoetvoesiella caeni]|uniref:Uncharacterized protein n=1 Tax=Eoetvoesiella caeni TaxID=645616 RepID=A0A366HAB7_9BURK|nr:hypothetical protein [Eoetvoesiella caeni]MCI2809547.1 hypothetical protein [Eoetvoesiella caeni]NYT56043.1 hypothetical protein [Eoetvoesiella caeni]RBP38807.1 hypothetical protein DFR37_10699 [Eoetvoesiella caeni]